MSTGTFAIVILCVFLLYAAARIVQDPSRLIDFLIYLAIGAVSGIVLGLIWGWWESR